jgi:hypothetical protein
VVVENLPAQLRNPYRVSELWEPGWSEHKVQFTGLPHEAVIRFFNSSGELIRTLQHQSQSSIAEWNLKNEFDQLAAPGDYFFYIKSAAGEKKDKFIIVL